MSPAQCVPEEPIFGDTHLRRPTIKCPADEKIFGPECEPAAVGSVFFEDSLFLTMDVEMGGRYFNLGFSVKKTL